MRESALRTIKTQQYVRTNQFEVDASVLGLIEKFSVLNREDLAEALKARVEEVAKVSRSKWTPEILSLFLNLSDRPVEKSNVEALELLRPPTPPESPLTWDEIVADDPLSGDIWDEVSYSAGSSEDDDAALSRSTGPSKKTSTPSKPKLHEDSDGDEKNAIFVTSIGRILDKLEQSQFWKAPAGTGTQTISELQTVREVILMLRGLPTSLFGLDTRHSIIFYSADISLVDVSNSSLNDTLQSLASIGSDLFRLRSWIHRPQTTPLLQAFHFSVASRLRDFDKDLAEIERGTAAPSVPITVSLMKLHQTIRLQSRSLLHLVSLVDRVPSKGSGFACLELLYDEISLLQASGDLDSYEVLARIFFECLKIYLRPVRRWIEAGELADQDDSFFVTAAETDCPLSALWWNRYILRMTADGQLYAPKFLESAGRKILNAGKSIVFLRELSLLYKVPPTLTEPLLEFDDISAKDSLLSLAPFSELFGVALDDWVRSKYGPASSILCQQLFSHCSLGLYMDALEHIYFSKDGIRFQSFADELFQRMDDRQKVWNDRFLLSELARGIFGDLPGIEEGRIGVRTLQAKRHEGSVKVLSTIVIDLSVSTLSPSI
jgi:gamma-tubulin complex component 5